jgi:hypothetical protein
LPLVALILYVGPPALMALAGVLLFAHKRSGASMFIALGFVAALASQLGQVWVGVRVSSYINTTRIMSFPYEHLDELLHWLGLVGTWVAAIGLVWLAMQSYASPNNRWRGP